jgi:dipeptidyl aminopeptidase/acylaminoacyl peptidase
LLAAALVLAAAAPSPPAVPLYTVEQLLEHETVGGASFSADGRRVLFHSNQGGRFNVYSAPVAGGPATVLTRSTGESTYAVSYFPQDDRALIARGEGVRRLLVRELDGHERDLTPGPSASVTFVGWTRKGDAFYVASNERDPRLFDLHRHDTRGYARTLVFRNDGGGLPGPVSSDARYVALWRPRTGSRSDLVVWDSVRRQGLQVSPPDADAWYEPVGFDNTARFLYYLTNDGSEFTRLRRCDVPAGRHEDVERADWDVALATLSPPGGYRATATNADGRSRLRVHDTRSGREVPAPEMPAAEIHSLVVGPTEDRLAFYASGDRGPSDLYVWVFSEPQPRPITRALGNGVEAATLVESESVRFASFDGLQIPARLWKPRGVTPGGKAPALVWVPGGPGGQVRGGWSPLVQYLASHGYVVLGVNHRGSSGYGKAFAAADDGKHGREPVRDCVEAMRYLGGLPGVDAARVGIIGSGYGGFMVLAALAFFPDEFAAGVDMFGIANWVRTLESVSAAQEAGRALLQEIGDPATHREMLTSISPLFHADRIRRPLLVVQGAEDTVVPRAEAEEIVAKARGNGVPVEYVVFPDEGHGFRRRQNEADAYAAILQFLDSRLKGAAR